MMDWLEPIDHDEHRAIDQAIRKHTEAIRQEELAAVEAMCERVVAKLPHWHGPFRPQAIPHMHQIDHGDHVHYLMFVNGQRVEAITFVRFNTAGN